MVLGAERSFAETRVALVIGNGAYQNAPQLPNPLNDANDVAAALKREGFDTILATNLNKDGMQDAAIRFARAARTADVAVFYYSGHAIQFAGVNYLAPVDILLNDEADLRRMIRVDEIVSDLQQAKNLRILVLDSCRDNPLADQLKRSIGATRSLPLQRGLARIDSPQGMIVAYATQAGRTAEDGDGRNSPYTAAFLRNIEAREEIGTIFRRISSDVYEATKHEQLPELSLSLIGEFYLRGKIEVNAKPEAPSFMSDTARGDFEAAERVDTIGGWDAFLAQHPSGYFAALAKERRIMAAAKVAALPGPATPSGDIPAGNLKHTPLGTAAVPSTFTTVQQCSAKYQAAKAAGTLNGMTWNDFRKTRRVQRFPKTSGLPLSCRATILWRRTC
jgi:Caspase domain